MKLPSGESGYDLYTLIHDPEATVQFSPYVWKTIVALRYLHVPFTQKHLTFDDIRTKLAKELDDEKVLVPVLKDEGGEWIKDSFEITLYLDRAHALPKGKSLFLHGVGGREFCRFINFWTDTVLAPDLGVLVRPRVYAALPPDSPSAKYFLSTRFGSSVDTASSALSKANDPAFRSEQFTQSRKTLQLLHTMLEYQASQGKKFIGGEFSYADGCVFGWYMFSTRWVPECREEVWERLGRVKEWLGAVKALGVISEEEMEAGK